MAADILEKRLGDLAPLRIDLIGITSILDGDARDWRETRAMHDARDVRLRADLQSGAWAERNRDLLELDRLDAGLVLVVAGA